MARNSTVARLSRPAESKLELARSRRFLVVPRGRSRGRVVHMLAWSEHRLREDGRDFWRRRARLRRDYFTYLANRASRELQPGLAASLPREGA